MPKTESNPVTIGSPAREFTLPDAQGNPVALADFSDRPALLVAFISNRCPFVVLLREQLAAYARDYADNGLAIIAINANDPAAHAEESADRLGEEARQFGYESLISRTPPKRSQRRFRPPARQISSSMTASAGWPTMASSTMRVRATASQ